MPSVCAERLGFSYSDRVRLLDNVHFRLSEGWYGLVGANGMGKTTLARLIAGELRPAAGRLWLEPACALVRVCAQELSGISEEIAQFAVSDDRESCRQRGFWGLDCSTLERFERLSAGERKRWQLGAALASAPDVLIVDEPTNHLDAEGRARLVAALRQFRGIGIAISHDRDLLDALTQFTLRIHDARVTRFPAPYTAARELWRGEAERVEALRQELCQRRQRLQKRVHAVSRDKVAAQQQRSARSRMKSIHDHDGSSFAATERAANGETSISRRLGVLSTELERLVEAIPEFVVDRTIGRSVFADYQPSPKRHILGLSGEDVRAGEQVILRGVCVTLERDERVHLRGCNGSGKTTLLKALLARSTSLGERLLYLPQELDADDLRALRPSVAELGRAERGRLLGVLAALGVDPARVLDCEVYSPGEARKLKLAFGLCTHAWGLVLDEPTNHLDLESIERLEHALAAYPGALLVVSHDGAFARNCTTGVWEIREGRIVT